MLTIWHLNAIYLGVHLEATIILKRWGSKTWPKFLMVFNGSLFFIFLFKKIGSILGAQSSNAR